jgi:hypothetical protein
MPKKPVRRNRRAAFLHGELGKIEVDRRHREGQLLVTNFFDGDLATALRPAVRRAVLTGVTMQRGSGSAADLALSIDLYDVRTRAPDLREAPAELLFVALRAPRRHRFRILRAAMAGEWSSEQLGMEVAKLPRRGGGRKRASPVARWLAQCLASMPRTLTVERELTAERRAEIVQGVARLRKALAQLPVELDPAEHTPSA